MSNLDNPLNHSFLQDDAPGADISEAVGGVGSFETWSCLQFFSNLYIQLMADRTLVFLFTHLGKD